MKMEKRLDTTLRQGYVCRVAEMLNSGMILTLGLSIRRKGEIRREGEIRRKGISSKFLSKLDPNRNRVNLCLI